MKATRETLEQNSALVASGMVEALTTGRPLNPLEILALRCIVNGLDVGATRPAHEKVLIERWTLRLLDKALHELEAML